MAATGAANVLAEPLAIPTGVHVVKRLAAADATYVLLNRQSDNLRRIMLLCGTRERLGLDGIPQTFAEVANFWHIEPCETHHVFRDHKHAAEFGRFRYQSAEGEGVQHAPAIVATANRGAQS